jgi:glucose-6-phosphate isomerase, archaeal
MNTRPFGMEILSCENRLSKFHTHIRRPLSALKGQFADQAAYDRMLQAGDPVVYEVYEVQRPVVAGELPSGLSIVHPGRVGDEYFMTKGHFHSVRDTAEIYHCLKGHGLLLMQNEAGEWAAEELRPGRLVYVAPRWAHRSINLSETEDLVTFFVYPGHAGHDYEAIERRGFLKLVVQCDGTFRVVDNLVGSGVVEG